MAGSSSSSWPTMHGVSCRRSVRALGRSASVGCRGPSWRHGSLARTQVTDEQATALARLADGRAGRALALVDRPDLVEWRRRVAQELTALLDRGRAERMAAVRELLDEASRLSPAASPAADGEATEPATRTPTDGPSRGGDGHPRRLA